jgi:hypothetical protein
MVGKKEGRRAKDDEKRKEGREMREGKNKGGREGKKRKEGKKERTGLVQPLKQLLVIVYIHGLVCMGGRERGEGMKMEKDGRKEWREGWKE